MLARKHRTLIVNLHDVIFDLIYVLTANRQFHSAFSLQFSRLFHATRWDSLHADKWRSLSLIEEALLANVLVKIDSSLSTKCRAAIFIIFFKADLMQSNLAQLFLCLELVHSKQIALNLSCLTKLSAHRRVKMLHIAEFVYFSARWLFFAVRQGGLMVDQKLFASCVVVSCHQQYIAALTLLFVLIWSHFMLLHCWCFFFRRVLVFSFHQKLLEFTFCQFCLLCFRSLCLGRDINF